MSAVLEVVTRDRTYEQRVRALRLGNEVRSRRAQLKRDVKAGRVSVVSLLEDTPDWLLTMCVIDLLLAVPHVGRVKAQKALKVAKAGPRRRFGELSAEQRRVLIQAFGGRR